MIGNPIQLVADAPVTSSGIPIRNLWYMLLYAWNELRVRNHWKVEIESAPTLDALLAAVLAILVQQRMRIGLGRDYRPDEGLIRGVRGRVDFTTSLKRLAFQHGQAHCRFHTYGPNVPKNQIIRTTLDRLAQIGSFGTDHDQANELRHRLRRLVRDLETIDLIELKPETIRREQLRRQDADYRLILAICYLICQRQMPTESEGQQELGGLDRDAMTLWRVFERFIANFYAARLEGWTVNRQVSLSWHESKTSQFLPAMSADLVLHENVTNKCVVLDTKFTAKILVPGRWGNAVFNRDHLFQMYAYLRSQDDVSSQHRRATGILLYPTVKQHLSDSVEMQGHSIRWETVDLSQEWTQIETQLLLIMACQIETEFAHVAMP